MSSCRNWTYSRSSTTVRDAESFVKVQVGNIATQKTELGVANDRVGVCAVDVDLTPGLVNQFTNIRDGLFVNTVSGRVGHH